MDEEIQPPQHFALLAAIFEAALAVAAVGLGYLVGQAPLASFRWSLGDAAWGAVATLPLLALLWLCLKCRIRPFEKLIQVVDEMLVPLFANCRLVELAVISLLAGLGEEMLFRGVIQAAVEDWIGDPLGVYVALAVAAILFALAHHITFTYALLAGLIGLYLGWIWLQTENLLVPIITHAAYDFIALVYLVRFRNREPRAA